MELNILYQSIFKGEKIGPEKVMISPTDYCNLKCKICWRLEKGEKLDEPSFHEIKRWLKECKELEVKVIDLTGGGEAFMRKDIILILKLVKKFGFYGTLTTNGTLLNEEKIKKIIKMRWDDLAFSLDGPNERINDFIRGKGVFEKVIKNIKKINNLKKEKRVKKENPRLEIFCLDPSLTTSVVNDCYASVHLSGTLKPIEQYVDCLSLEKERVLVRSFPSPFPEKNRLYLYLKILKEKLING